MLLCLACATAAPRAHAQQQDNDPATQAVNDGISFLMTNVNADGSVSRGGHHANAMTSLSIMALTAVGHQPTDHSPQGKVLRDAIGFILREDRQDREGYFGRSDGSRMYGHGITTLMLCEMLGMGIDDGQDRLIRDRAERAIDLILKAQAVSKRNSQHRGGWRYEPSSNDSDLSVTVWQLMALRAGKAAGIDVPAQAIDDAVAYLEVSYRQTGRDKGGFGYEPGQHPRYATTAAGLLAMQVCGRYDHEQVAGAAAFLDDLGPQPNDQWFFYGSYYYAIGMDQVGGDRGDKAERAIWDALSRMQRSDGSWSGRSQEGDPVYATSMAILALSVRYHFLPIYQR